MKADVRTEELIQKALKQLIAEAEKEGVIIHIEVAAMYVNGMRVTWQSPPKGSLIRSLSHEDRLRR